jgi:hypothetical protein
MRLEICLWLDITWWYLAIRFQEPKKDLTEIAKNVSCTRLFGHHLVVYNPGQDSSTWIIIAKEYTIFLIYM